MSESADNWAEIETAYRSGTPLNEIRARFGVSLAEILTRAKAGGWKRRSGRASAPAGDAAKESKPRGDDVARLPVRFTPVIEAAIGSVLRETAADIAASHKGIAQKLRMRLESELAEFDEAAKYLGRFRDTDHIARLAAQNDGGKELRAYLTQCLAHHAERAAMLERLSRIGGQVVDLERAVWGLDDGDDATHQSFEDLLEACQKPLAPRELPPNVIDFERRLGMANPRRGGG